MHQVLRLFAACLTVAVLACLAGPLSAQQAASGPPPIKQIALTERQVEGFIAAHKDMVEAFDKLQNEKSEKVVLGQLDKVAKKFGFKDHADYDIVVTNITNIMFGIDPQTKAFTDPPTVAKRDLDAAMNDKSLPEADRKRLVEDLTEQAKMVQPVMHPANVELVKKYYEKIEPLLQ
jgi:hypothetical protein